MFSSAAQLQAAANGNVFVRGADNRIAKVTRNGTALQLVTTDLAPNAMPTLVTSVGNRFYAVVETANPLQDQVLFSTDGGLHWTAAGFPASKYTALHAVGTRLYTQTIQGALVSLNEGASWNPLTLPTNATARAFASNRQYLYLSTTDGRLYLSPLP